MFIPEASDLLIQAGDLVVAIIVEPLPLSVLPCQPPGFHTFGDLS
jgi:hypothetical protein